MDAEPMDKEGPLYGPNSIFLCEGEGGILKQNNCKGGSDLETQLLLSNLFLSLDCDL